MPAKNSPAKSARLTVPADVADRLRAEAERQDIDLKTLLTDIIESYLEQVGRREWPDLSGSIANALSSVGPDDPRPRVVPKR